MPFLQPDHTFLCYRDVSTEFLKREGIEVLLLDIDNTLAPYEQPEPDAHIRGWLSALAEAGVRVAFVSNNDADRVTLFNKSLGLPAYHNAHKPLAGTAKKVMKLLGGNKQNTALMGDQIFTDVFCARMTGIRAFLVPPIKDRTDWGTRFKRKMEKGILKRYYKRHPDAPDIRKGSSIKVETV